MAQGIGQGIVQGTCRTWKGDMSDMVGDMSEMVGDMPEMNMPDGIAAEIAQLRTRLGAAVTWGSAEQMALAEQILRRQESWAKGRSVKP